MLIHEYCTGGTGSQALAAGILGLHFALTTDGGRCYSREEISSLVEHGLGPHKIVGELVLPISTCLMFRKGGQP